jgi:hypothetical protein
MNKKTFLTIIAIFALLAGMVGRTHAQTVDKVYAKSLILAGGKTDATHVLSLTAPTLTGPISDTLPSVNFKGPLTNDGTGGLNWGGPTSVIAGSANQFLVGNAVPAVVWQSFLIDTTFQGNGISTAIGIALGNSDNWTVAPTMQQNAIGTTSTDALMLTNATAATSGQQQQSPRLHLKGHGWGGSSQSVDWVMQNIPVAGSSAPLSHLDFQNSVNGAAYSTKGFDLFSSGGATLGVANPADPGAGVFNAATGFQIGGIGNADSGKMLIGNGTNYVPTAFTYPTVIGRAGNILWSNGAGFFSDSVTTAQYSSSQLGNPTGTTSTTGVMMGLGAGSTPATFTPHGSGIILILITGNMASTHDTGGVSAQIHYADNSIITAPAHAAAPVGTAVGGNITTVMANGANQWFFSLNAIIGGGGSPLTVGHTYWIDVDIKSNGYDGNTGSINNVTISSVELE